MPVCTPSPEAADWLQIVVTVGGGAAFGLVLWLFVSACFPARSGR